jgi:hypothetical protein
VSSHGNRRARERKPCARRCKGHTATHTRRKRPRQTRSWSTPGRCAPRPNGFLRGARLGGDVQSSLNGSPRPCDMGVVMLNRRRPLRLVVIALTALAVVTACERRNQPTAPPPPPPAPVPTPTPLPTPSVAPAPMPTTGSDPVAPQRTQVVSLLDQIEALLVECESNQMQHVEPQTRRIEELVGQMATSVASPTHSCRPRRRASPRRAGTGITATCTITTRTSGGPQQPSAQRCSAPPGC